jgi:2-polyprenyl-3-methyl-5-hydroxy-6-metoxy-1,4-benzoquinol methylase
MIRCRQCASMIASDAEPCACGWAPPIIDGFMAWAPELSSGSTGLSDHSFSLIAQYERDHFWFRSRNAVITSALRTYFPAMRSFLEIGCGTGIVLQAVAEAFPQARLTGSEMATAGLGFAMKQAPSARLVQMDGRDIPYESEFDVVSAFDVLEHIEEDEAVLPQLSKAVVPGGGLLISVPQHQWLWSAVDDYSRHCRRYSRGELVAKIERAGFVVEHVTSFMTFILPAMLLSRVSKRDAAALDPGKELRIGSLANATLFAACRAERVLTDAGVSLPIGGSLLAVGRRPGR